MSKLLDLVKRNKCCKNTVLTLKSCQHKDICFTDNHNFGLASIEDYPTIPNNLTGGTYVLPVYLGYSNNPNLPYERYLSYSKTQYIPIGVNKIYKFIDGNNIIYRYIQVAIDGRILSIS